MGKVGKGLVEDGFFDPLALSIAQAASNSQTELYEALARRDLRGKKHGRRTKILVEDLRQYLHSLPSYPTKGE